MTRQLRTLALVIFVGGVVGLVFSGCKRPPTPSPGANKGDGPKQADTFRGAAESFRYNPGSGDDWTRFRDALQTLDNYFSSPAVADRVHLTEGDRKFLTAEANLSPAEFAEIEARSFRPADAHYLDECFLLRDAARFIEVGNASPLRQVQSQFDWVVRNVILHEQVDAWLPPAFVLRRGYGGAIDRAIIFLSLLRQSRIDGCLLMPADPGGDFALVGVLEPKTANIRLFDPRLGLPVRAKDGKSIATLKEALADPALLAPSGLTPEQTKKLEARLVCPLHALSPRMKELETGLGSSDPVVLHIPLPTLQKNLAAVVPMPVKVWNAPAEGKTLPNSPTRSLWLFLPKQEGGLDDGRRADGYLKGRLPYANVRANLALINVTEDSLNSRQAFGMLMRFAEDLLNKYDVQPREMHLRGQREAMARRQQRMEPFVDSPALVGLERDREFVTQEIPQWYKTVRAAYSDLDFTDAQQRDKAQRALASLWGQDFFLGRLIEVDKDEKFERDDKILSMKKTVLTKILAVGTRDYFSFEMARMQAAANHERAARMQAIVDANPRAGNDARNRAEKAWLDAASAWSHFYLERTSLQSKFDQAWPLIQRSGDLETRLRLLESLHVDVHKYFQARICLAECKRHSDADAKAARLYLEETRREIESMERKSLMKNEINDLIQIVRTKIPEPARTYFLKRLDLLAGDWGEHGNFSWIEKRCQNPFW